MEIINESGFPEKSRPRKDNASNIYLGIVLILTGIVWLLYNIKLITYGAFHFIFSWQMLLVAVGGYLLAARRWTSGTIIGGLGVVLVLMESFHIPVSFTKIILPALVIACGIAVILSITDRKR